jgi:uncharacterized Zn-finger protein
MLKDIEQHEDRAQSWGAVAVSNGPLNWTTATAAISATAALRRELYIKIHHADTTHPDDPIRGVSAASLVMMCPNNPLKTPTACTSLDESTTIQSPKTWQEQTSLDNNLNQSSLMNQEQVQVHRQHCLTIHDDESAVSVAEKALATSGPRVESKHVPKIFLEWGEDKMLRPDFR